MKAGAVKIGKPIGEKPGICRSTHHIHQQDPRGADQQGTRPGEVDHLARPLIAIQHETTIRDHAIEGPVAGPIWILARDQAAGKRSPSSCGAGSSLRGSGVDGGPARRRRITPPPPGAFRPCRGSGRPSFQRGLLIPLRVPSLKVMVGVRTGSRVRPRIEGASMMRRIFRRSRPPGATFAGLRSARRRRPSGSFVRAARKLPCIRLRLRQGSGCDASDLRPGIWATNRVSRLSDRVRY